MPAQQILQNKITEVDKTTDLIKQFKVISIANLQKVRATQLQELRRNLTEKVLFKVIKNTIMKRAFENCKPQFDELVEYLTGANLYLFTNLTPFKLALMLEKSKVMIIAKSGDLAAFDVIVPEGNTAQPPGPIISQLNSVGIPTRIESGSVWVSKDTLVVKKGETISPGLASVLSKLGIKATEAGLSVKLAYDDGVMVKGEQLRINLEEVEEKIKNAHADAFLLSTELAYPSPETIPLIIQMAHNEARNLSINVAIPTKETIEFLIKKAIMEMESLKKRVHN